MKYGFILALFINIPFVKSQTIEKLFNKEDSISIRLKINVESKFQAETVENIEILKYLCLELSRGELKPFAADSNAISDTVLGVKEVLDIIGSNIFIDFSSWDKFELHERLSKNIIMVYPWEKINPNITKGFIIKNHPLSHIFEFYDAEGVLVKENKSVRFIVKSIIIYGNNKYFAIGIPHINDRSEIGFYDNKNPQMTDIYFYLKNLTYSYEVVSLDGRWIGNSGQRSKIRREISKN